MQVVDALPSRVGDGHAEDLGVGAGLVLHPEHAQEAHLDVAARKCRLVDDDEDVEGIAVLGQGLGHEPVVGGIAGGGEQLAVEPDVARLVFHLVFVARPAGDLDDGLELHDRCYPAAFLSGSGSWSPRCDGGDPDNPSGPRM